MLRDLRGAVQRRAVRDIPSLHHLSEHYRWWVLANVMIGTFMAVLDATIVDVSLAKLIATFGVSVDRVQWVITAYMLVFAVMLPTSGWVADHFGYKRTYFLGLSLFTLGSFLCSLSWSFNALIMFRLVQGCGAGMLMPVGMAIVTREFPPRQRGVALGFWSVAAAASISLGPMLGGYLIDAFSWHAIFDVNIPVGLVGLAATFIIQREYRTEHTRSFDLAGFVAMSLFLSCLLLGLSNANAAWNTGGWGSPFSLTCFGLAVAGLAVFLIVEFSAAHPLIELRLLANRNFGLGNLVMFVFGMGMFGSTFLMPLYLQNAMGYSAFQAGMFFLPVGLIQMTVGPTTGLLVDRINPKITAVTGVTLMAFSLFINHYLTLYSEHTQIMTSLCVRGLGMGMMFTSMSTLALSDIPRHKMAQASGLFNVIRQIGGSFGIAMFGTMLTHRALVHQADLGGAIDQHSPAFRAVMARLMMHTRQIGYGTASGALAQAQNILGTHIGLRAFVAAVADDFLVASGITACCLLLILTLKRPQRGGGHAHAPLE